MAWMGGYYGSRSHKEVAAGIRPAKPAAKKSNSRLRVKAGYDKPSILIYFQVDPSIPIEGHSRVSSSWVVNRFMGRYDFRPLRVHQTATQLLQANKGSSPPPWYNVVSTVPPAQALVRTQPLPHAQRNKRKQTKKASKLFQPQQITYDEDRLRQEFFGDHPWELARPRMVIEDDGRDSYKTNWSRLEQSEKGLSGER